MFTNNLQQSTAKFLLPLVVLVLSIDLTILNAQYEPSFNKQSEMKDDSTEIAKIELRRKFLGAQKFIYNGNEPQNVYNFSGITFRPGFKDVMSLHPPALREAKKAFPFNALSTASWVAILGLTFKNLLDTINQAEKVSNGEIVNAGFELSYVVQIGVAAAVASISSRIGNSHLKKGVAIFNERQERKLSIGTIKPNANQERANNSKDSNKGLKFGISFANINSETSEGTKSNTGLTLGGYFMHNLNNSVLLQTEVLFSQKGYKFTSSFSEGAIRLGYLEIPVLVKVSLPRPSTVKPSILLGPALGIKLSSNREINGESSNLEGINTTDLGLVIGADGKFGQLPLTLDIRYTIGLTSIVEEVSIKNRAISVMLGYSL